MNNFTADGGPHKVARIRDVADGLRRIGEFESAEMLRAFANRIEADESAVPVLQILPFAEVDWLQGGPCQIAPGTKLFTHPSAQVAVVDKYRALCAATYQAAGAYDLPVRFLDALSDAANGHIENRQLTDSLLPCYTPTAEPVAQAGADGGVGIDCVSHSPDAADGGRVVTDEMVRVAVHAWNAAPALGRDEDDDYAMRRALTAALAVQPQSAASPAGVPDGMTWDAAKLLARKAIYADGRGMIGAERRFLEDRVARAILAAAPQPGES